jgi:hypothetical protein
MQKAPIYPNENKKKYTNNPDLKMAGFYMSICDR